MKGFLRDISGAVRSLTRDRRFTAFAVCLIAFGAGLVTSMFALVDAVSLRKLDAPDPDSLFGIVALREDGGKDPIPVALFERLAEHLDAADSMCAMANTYVPVTHEGRTEPLFVEFMSGDLYRTVGVRALLGRALTSADDGPVAVISEAYWRRIGQPVDIVGKVIRAGSVPLTIVGVAPSTAHRLWRFIPTELIVPFRIGMLLEGTPPERAPQVRAYVTARLKRGVTVAQIEQRLDALWPRLLAETIPRGRSLEEWTRTAGARARLLPASRGYPGTGDGLAHAAATLFVFAGLVALAVCANLAGLLLSRGLARQKQYAVEMALGASRANLVRRAFGEALVLSTLGGAGALLLSAWLTSVCARLIPLPWGALHIDYGVRVDGRVAAFAVAAALATAVAAQIAPALRFSRLDVVDSLRVGQPTASARLAGRKALLAVQVAAAMALVSGAVLFVRTLQVLGRVGLGFHADGVLIATLAPTGPWPAAQPEYFQELLRRVRALPSVTAAGLADRIPMEHEFRIGAAITTLDSGNPAEADSDTGCVWPGFFDTMKIPVLVGRDFQDSDRAAAILSRELAQGLFPDAEPLGRHVRVGRAPHARTYQVVGVVGDVPFRSPRQQETRMIFVPCQQVWTGPQTRYAMSLAIRSGGDPGAVEPALRLEVDTLGKQVVFQVISLERLVAKSTERESILATIGSGFGALALALSCLGVYSLIELTALARRRELGIRMALGAEQRDVLRLVLADATRIFGVGASMGLVATVVAARVYRAFLFGVAGLEPALMIAPVAIVLLFTVPAALLPALRAARVDPVVALRCE